MNSSRNYAKFGVTSARQKRNMDAYLRDYSRDIDGVIYDAETVDLLLDYVKDPTKTRSILKFLKCKGYCQSRKDTSQLDQQIDRFSERHVSSKITFPAYRAALAYVNNRMPRNLLPLQFSTDEDIVEAIPRKDTNAGLTGILTGRKLKGDNLEEIFPRWKAAMEEALTLGTFNTIDLGGVRTQNSSPFEKDGQVKEGDAFPKPSKTRLILMVDMMRIITSLMFAKPLQNALVHASWYAGGKTPLELRRRVHDIGEKCNYWYSLDYSHFDASIPGWLIRDAFSLLKSCFRSVNDDIWNVMVHDFVNKTLVRPNGDLVTAHDGIPSGDMFTQIIGSLCNYIMIVTYLFSRNIKAFDTITMGDDNLLGVYYPLDLDDLANYMHNMFGAVINPLKADEGRKQDPPYFLSREWRRDGEWRHPNVLLAKIAYPERMRQFDDKATPADVIYSYCLTFPIGMAELIDMSRFLNDYQPEIKQILGDKNAKNLSGLMKFQLLYRTRPVDNVANYRPNLKRLC